MTDKFENHVQEVTGDVTRDILANLTAQDFLSFGVHDLAYIRPVEVDGRKSYAIHAANGVPLGVVEDFDAALGTITGQDMQATSLQ